MGFWNTCDKDTGTFEPTAFLLLAITTCHINKSKTSREGHKFISLLLLPCGPFTLPDLFILHKSPAGGENVVLSPCREKTDENM